MTTTTPRHIRVPTDVTCRCAGCDHVFANPDLFDSHRSLTGEHGACQEPQMVTDRLGNRVMFYRAGVWRSFAAAAGALSARRVAP